MTDADHALLRLHACGGRAGPRRRLLEAWPDPAAAVAAAKPAWHAAGLSPTQIRALRGPPPAALLTCERWLQAPAHHVIGWTHPDYPALLRHSAHPPLALFVAGDPALLWHPAVAVVGSRAPTPCGRANACAFSQQFARAGLGITSGLAAGVDTAAHHAALESGGITVAVLGTGPDVVYPRANRALHERIANAGAIVTEHPPGTPARREHFPTRNRILAGLSLGTVVIEAAERSGALITARLAAESGRNVFALPGSIHNPLARGCHRLIRDGASLVESPQEVIEDLWAVAESLGDALRARLGVPIQGDLIQENLQGNLQGDVKADGAPRAGTAATPEIPPGSGDADYNRLWRALGHDPTGMDELVQRCRLTTAKVSSMLLLMELEGRVAMQHGRYFRCR